MREVKNKKFVEFRHISHHSVQNLSLVRTIRVDSFRVNLRRRTTGKQNIPMQASSATTTRIRYVLDFWFGKPSDADYLKSKPFWYGDDAADNHVRQHLSDDYEKAKCGQYNDWLDSADGALALVILLDQVPRNIFRNTAQAYATDDKALEIAKRIVASGWDEHQPDIVRRYMYSPFNHSENLEDQRRSVELFTKLGDREHLHWAKNFYDTIKTYGRFPHRDGILGRRPSS